MYRLLLSVLVIGLNVAYLSAQEKPAIRSGQVTLRNKAQIIENRSVAVTARQKDTIPLGRNKYYKVDDASNLTYMNSSINKDSVKLEKASKTDWEEFAKAYAGLQSILQLNRFDNVVNYIDTSKDFIEMKLLKQDFFPNAAKVCLRQLTFNVQLLNQLLARPLPENTDVQLLSSVMNNIDILVNKYVATKGVTMTIRNVLLPNVNIKVFDNNGAELTNAKCYFISFKTCRDIACRSCIPGLDPCADNNINAIINKPDVIFDCTNPVKIKIDYGHYHFFVINNNKIRHYEQMHIDENRLSSEDNQQIRINLQ